MKHLSREKEKQTANRAGARWPHEVCQRENEGHWHSYDTKEPFLTRLSNNSRSIWTVWQFCIGDEISSLSFLSRAFWSASRGSGLVLRNNNLPYFKNREIIRNVERLHHQKDQQEREKPLFASEMTLRSAWNFFWISISLFCSLKKASWRCGKRFRNRSKYIIFRWTSNYSHTRTSATSEVCVEEEHLQVNDFKGHISKVETYW